MDPTQRIAELEAQVVHLQHELSLTQQAGVALAMERARYEDLISYSRHFPRMIIRDVRGGVEQTLGYCRSVQRIYYRLVADMSRINDPEDATESEESEDEETTSVSTQAPDAVDEAMATDGEE